MYLVRSMELGGGEFGPYSGAIYSGNEKVGDVGGFIIDENKRVMAIEVTLPRHWTSPGKVRGVCIVPVHCDADMNHIMTQFSRPNDLEVSKELFCGCTIVGKIPGERVCLEI